MSLDIDLRYPQEPTDQEKAVALLRANGFEKQAERLSCTPDPEYIGAVFSDNYTHNANKMASEAGIYEVVWRPDEVGITHAKQIVEKLEAGIKLMRDEPERFIALQPENGWGSYDSFLPWLERYLKACKAHPEALVSADR